MSPTPFWNRHPRGDLSAQVDGELTSERTERLEAHLATCQACRTELAALREAKSALASLPEAAAPRSFALTPEMVAPRQYVRPAAPQMAFGLRVASAGLAVALAAVVLVDLGGGSDGGSSGDDSGPMQELANVTAASDAGTENNGAAQADDMGADDSFDSLRAQSTTPHALQPTNASIGETATPVGAGGVSAGDGNDASPPEDEDNHAPVATPTSGSVPQNSSGGSTDAPYAPEPSGDNNFSGQLDDSLQDNADADGEAAVVPAPAGSSGGGDTLLIAEIMLGVGLVLALAASVVVTRLGRRVS